MRQYDFLDYHRKRALRVEGMQQEFTYIEQFLALLTGDLLQSRLATDLNGNLKAAP
jgi:hypothetical protein